MGSNKAQDEGSCPGILELATHSGCNNVAVPPTISQRKSASAGRILPHLGLSWYHTPHLQLVGCEYCWRNEEKGHNRVPVRVPVRWKRSGAKLVHHRGGALIQTRFAI